MSAADIPARQPWRVQARLSAILSFMVGVWVFCGGFVPFEPSPYELAFMLVLPIALYAGFSLYRGTLPIMLLLIFFLPFCFIAAMQVTHVELNEALLYMAVTIFLWFTAFFTANYVAQAPLAHVRVIMRGYVAAALIAALIGIFAYLGLMPGAELFLRYGRAKATFEDPNVYGPFLMLPAMFCLQHVLLSPPRKAVFAAIMLALLFVGIFVSFSRAAWGHLALSSLIVYWLTFHLEACGRDKVRLILLALAGFVVLALIVAALLSIEQVRELFVQRFALVQSYDTGTSGRFGRLAYAFELALNHPWGLGPHEFSRTRIIEDPHNSYLKAFLTYGWVGGFAFICLMLATLWRGLVFLGIASPNRLLLIPVMGTYIALIMEAAVIDIDHWRHFYLIVGLIWGITASYRKDGRRQRTRSLNVDR